MVTRDSINGMKSGRRDTRMVEGALFRILVCRDCGERYDASGLPQDRDFKCAGCGRTISAGARLMKRLFEGPEDDPTSSLPAVPEKKQEGLRRIGSYLVVSEVARGGMGVVYRCRHLEDDRTVALKVLHSPRRSGRNMVQRFRHEARITAGLDHPNIVPVSDIGHEDGLHYFAMKYVEGMTVDCHLANPSFSIKDGLRWLVKIAKALDYMHQKGVVHRDVKPGNIIVDDAGEPYLIDFGLAKSIDAPLHMTKPGIAMGTPAYMSPEQAEGESKIDCRADVYSLGAVLFEMITGQTPFKGESLMETMLMVVSDQAPSIRKHKPDVDPSIEAVCLKALQKNRNKRYQTANAFAEDLSRILDGKPVTAKPQTLRDKVYDNIQRYKYPGILFMASMAGGFAALACVMAIAGRL
jgi:serine/threonine protein kinase